MNLGGVARTPLAFSHSSRRLGSAFGSLSLHVPPARRTHTTRHIFSPTYRLHSQTTPNYLATTTGEVQARARAAKSKEGMRAAAGRRLAAASLLPRRAQGAGRACRVLACAEDRGVALLPALPLCLPYHGLTSSFFFNLRLFLKRRARAGAHVCIDYYRAAEII
jgi:hypothetical protein